MSELENHHALVTGGGSGIGAAIAGALASAGAHVTIAGRRMEPLEKVAASHPRITPCQADVTDEDAVAALFRAARAAHGPVTIAVANAGAADSAPIERVDLDHWNQMITANLTSAFLTARAAMAHMREKGWGRIIFLSSTAGLKGYPYVAPYSAAKHGVIGLAKSLALETAKDGVTVNALCPGFVDTPLVDQSVERIVQLTGRSKADAKASLMKSNPQGKLITPEEVAAAALWLCCENARSVSGEAIAISGGEV